MTDPDGNTSGQPVDTHLMSVQQYKDNVPLMLDGRGREQHNLKELVRLVADRTDYATGRNAWPSVSWLADHMRVTRRAVFKLLRRAEEAKLILRDGKGPKGVTSWRLNLELDADMAWLPTVAAREHRREKSRETTRLWRERKAAGGEPNPVTRDQGVNGTLSPATSGDRVPFTQPVLDLQKEDHPKISAIADATPQAEEMAGTLALVVEPELSTPKAAEAVGVPATKVRRLVAEGRLVPDGRDAQGRAVWSALSLGAQLAACRQSDRIAAPVLSGPISSTSTVGRTPEARKAGKLYDPAGWPQPRPEYYETDRGLIVQKLVGDWIDTYKDARRADPGDGDAGRVGREIRQALVAGNNPNHVWEAVKLAARKGSPWVWGAMEDTHRGLPATAATNVSRTKGRVVDCPHGRFEVPAGLSRGDELTVSNVLARTVMRPEHWERLAALGVVKIG